MNAHTISAIKTRLAPFAGRFEHWHVSLDGEVSDVFKCLPDVVECSPERFFDRMASLMEERASFPYREAWKAAARKVGEDGSLMGERLKWSAVMATQRFMARVPEDAVVHLANSNTIRIANLFDLDPSVDVFCNRGTHGIDGSMSAYLAQSHESGRPSFLLIGDLSFFYDMNCLWTQYVGSNTRILVINNGGGAIFHTYPGTKNVPTLDEHIAAEHEASVEGWSRNRGFEYYSAHDETSLESSLDILFGDGSAPVLVEAFTDKDVDAAELAGICDRYRFGDPLLRSAASKILSAGVKDQIKKIIR